MPVDGSGDPPDWTECPGFVKKRRGSLEGFCTKCNTHSTRTYRDHPDELLEYKSLFRDLLNVPSWDRPGLLAMQDLITVKRDWLQKEALVRARKVPFSCPGLLVGQHHHKMVETVPIVGDDGQILNQRLRWSPCDSRVVFRCGEAEPPVCEKHEADWEVLFSADQSHIRDRFAEFALDASASKREVGDSRDAVIAVFKQQLARRQYAQEKVEARDRRRDRVTQSALLQMRNDSADV